MKKLKILLILVLLLTSIITIFRMNIKVKEVVSEKLGAKNDEIYMFDSERQRIEITTKLSSLDVKSIQLALFKGEKEYTNEKIVITVKNARTDDYIYSSSALLREQKTMASYICTTIVPLEIPDQKNDKVTIIIKAKDIIEPFGIALDKTNQNNNITLIDGELKNLNVYASIIYNDFYKNVIIPVIDFLIVVLICLIIYIWILHFKDKFPIKAPIKPHTEKRSNINKKAQIIFLISIITVFLISFVFFYFSVINKKVKIYKRVDITTETSGLTRKKLLPGGKLTQIIKPEENWLKKIKIYLDTDIYVDEDVNINISLNNSKGDLLYSSKRNIKSNISKEGIIDVELNKSLKNSLNEEYILNITNNSQYTITFRMGRANNNGYIINGDNDSQISMLIKAEYEHNHFMIYIYWIFFIGIFLLLLITYYMIFIKNYKLHVIYFIMALIVGSLFLIAIPIYGTPDEPSHIDTAYKYSNRLLGIPDSRTEGYIYKRQSDIDSDVDLQKIVSIEAYRRLYYGALSTNKNFNLVEAPAKDASGNANIFMYLPSSIGLTIGRLLRLNTTLAFTLGRWFNLLFCIVCICFSIRIIPKGKMALFALGSVPMVFQESASFSYDAVIIGIAFLFAASFYKIILDKKNNYAFLNIVILLSTGALLGSCKGGVYMPVVGAMCVIPFIKKIKNRWGYFIIAFSIGIVGLMFLRNNAGTLTSMFFRTAAVGGASGQKLYSVSYFFGHPLKFIYIMFNTLIFNSYKYIIGIVGGELSWLNVYISIYLIMGFIFIIGYCISDSNKKNVYEYTIPKLWVIIMCVISMLLVLISMLLAWTPFGLTKIEGVQGRYFIPILPMLLCGITKRKEIISPNKKTFIVFAIEILLMFVFINLVQYVFKF